MATNDCQRDLDMGRLDASKKLAIKGSTALYRIGSDLELSPITDRVYIFRRADVGKDLLTRRSTFYITNDQGVVFSVAQLKNVIRDSDLARNHIEIEIFDNDGVEFNVTRVARHWLCCPPLVKLSVKSADGEVRATVSKRRWSDLIDIVMRNNGKVDRFVLLREADESSRRFHIIDPNQQVRFGSVVQITDPLRLQGVHVLGGYYEIVFNEHSEDLEDVAKKVILSSVFLLVSDRE